MSKGSGFLLGAGAALMALCCLGVQAAEDAVGAAPNVLLIVTDDQRWDLLGLVQREQAERGRFPFLETPRLDALAAEGMRFRNAFVTTSLCSPSRSAMLTGQYNHSNGVFDNFTHFQPRPTWATALQREGYTTAMFGKWHHGKQQERPGFDVTATFVDQGHYLNSTFFVDGNKVKTQGYVDTVTTDFAIQFMEENRANSFAILLGFKAVHQPFTPMEEHATRYEGEMIGTAPNVNSVAPWRRLDPPRLAWNKRFFGMLRSIDGIDQNVGRLLDTLDRLDLAHNTLVIFTSDNGYYINEHGLGDKRSAYEESIRVPLLVRLPGVIDAGTVSDELVLNIDLAPTILDVLDNPVPEQMQGMSMLPLFESDAVAWRDSFLYEYWNLDEGSTFAWSARNIPTILAVRTATHKLITYPYNEGWTELFDLTTDAYEINNIAALPEAKPLKEALQAQLQQLLDETDFPEGDDYLLGSTAERKPGS